MNWNIFFSRLLFSTYRFTVYTLLYIIELSLDLHGIGLVLWFWFFMSIKNSSVPLSKSSNFCLFVIYVFCCTVSWCVYVFRYRVIGWHTSKKICREKCQTVSTLHWQLKEFEMNRTQRDQVNETIYTICVMS